MEVVSFVLNIGAALLLGAAIGLERTLGNHPAGLRTNGLVSLGAALFVSLSLLLAGSDSPARIAAQVVSGIGFLGGGVILREGLNVKGLNTAATLWCSAAVGTLAGAGFLLHAFLGTLGILALNVTLRPVSHWLNAYAKTLVNVEMFYRLRVVCANKDEALIRAIVLRHVNSNPAMIVQGIALQDSGQADRTAVVADIFSSVRCDRALEELVSRINIEPSVTAVSWEKVR
jgi:putative Mg2+ transporter-C (MgtC) family protein